MWQIAARQYTATNGMVNARYFSLLDRKRIKMRWRLGLNKSSGK
jgi:hypothetical protein